MDVKKYLELCERSHTGEKVSKDDWDMDYIIDTVQELVEEYEFEWDKQVIIPQDETLFADMFAAAKEDPAVKEVVDTYIRRLGTGIVNAVNIFRPRLVLLGGRISEQGDVLIKPLEEQLRQGCFGGEKSGIPEIRTAVLGSHAGMIGAASLI